MSQKSKWDVLTELQDQFVNLMDNSKANIFYNLSTLQLYCVENNYQDFPEDKEREARRIITETRRMIGLEKWASWDAKHSS